jgi:2-amino-4-hydroxy-6-hydroxymethyldihydropteridine diphosphokinase
LARAFLGIGSNVGDRAQYLKSAVRLLRNIPQSTVAKVSSIYETEPWGNPDQEAYLNQTVELQTGLEPDQLLESCQAIEFHLGREHKEKWGARTMDIDILLYDSREVHQTDLQIPHPRLSERRFMLVPLAEIAPELSVPRTGHTVSRMLEACEDTGGVRLYEPNG